MQETINYKQLCTLSRISKILNIPKNFIKRHIKSDQIKVNKNSLKLTYFYQLENVEEILQRKQYQDILKDYHAKHGIYEETVYEHCYVTWLEWYGPRNNRMTYKREFYNVTVSIKNKTATITTESGQSFTKRLSKKGFHYLPNQPIKTRYEDEVFDFDVFTIDNL